MCSRPRAVLGAVLVIVSYLGPIAAAVEEGWVPLFDGTTLNGWKVRGGFAS
jgi:hypothetical protein